MGGRQLERHGKHGDQQKQEEKLECPMCFTQDGLRSKIRFACLRIPTVTNTTSTISRHSKSRLVWNSGT